MQTFLFRHIYREAIRLDLPSTTTIGECRVAVADQLGQIPTKLRLIFRGRVLRDTDILGSLGIGPDDFVVVHTLNSSADDAPPPLAAPEAVGPATQAINALMEIGYDRLSCEIALRAAIGDVNRAADSLGSRHIRDEEDEEYYRELQWALELEPEEQEEIDNIVAETRERLEQNPGFLEDLVRRLEDASDHGDYRAHPWTILWHLDMDPDTFDQTVLEAVRNGTAQPTEALPPPGGNERPD
jgi:hypothetical protein